ncbi:MAG: ABC transporter substrate-binding protein [Trichodesmium sp. MAG_R03]|nr:ABC transporter substrate-binding protein [Trichodesmium sp. MAG_R03]
MTNSSEEPQEPQSWMCQGTRSSPHEEIENWGDKCMYPGCSQVRNGNGSSSPPINKEKILIGGGVVAALALGAVLLNVVRPSPSPNPSPSVSPSPSPSVSPSVSPSISSSPSPSVSPNFTTNQPSSDLSSGEEVLLGRGIYKKFRDLGVEAFRKGNYGDAIKFFNKAVYNDGKDPEVQIFLNNAKARLNGNPILLATAVPIDNREGAAREMLRGVADAQTQFNDVGGVGNRLVEIIIANDSNNEKKAATIAQKLASNPNILGVIGHNSSGTTKKALPEYEKADLTVISPTSTSTSISSPVFFRTTPSDTIAGKKLADYTYDSKWNNRFIDNVVIFYNPSSPYSKSLQQAFATTFKQLGGKVVASIDISDPNFNPQRQISEIRGKVEAIALFPNTNLTSVAMGIIKANTEVTGKKFLMVGGDALYTGDTIFNGGVAANNLVLAVPWFSGGQNYAIQAQKRWKGTVNWRTATSFDATLALVNALSTNPSRKSVLQNLKSTNLPSSQTSGNAIKFTIQGEVKLEPVIVRIGKGVPKRPGGSDYGFELISR